MSKTRNKKKKVDRFEPEDDGFGKVSCPAKGKLLQQINTKPSSGTMADALKRAGLSR